MFCLQLLLKNKIFIQLIFVKLTLNRKIIVLLNLENYTNPINGYIFPLSEIISLEKCFGIQIQ